MDIYQWNNELCWFTDEPRKAVYDKLYKYQTSCWGKKQKEYAKEYCNNTECTNPFHINTLVSDKSQLIIQLLNYTYRTLTTWHIANYEYDFDPPHPDDELLSNLNQLIYHNYNVWHSEDYCRTKKPELIVPNKIRIDKHNQLRNDRIESIDYILMQNQIPAVVPYNSETLGSILDRFSIAILKIFHSLELSLSDRVAVNAQQSMFLARAAHLLWLDMLAGKRHIITFRQLKMYNDSSTNKKISDA